jgi:hypothetical protein
MQINGADYVAVVRLTNKGGDVVFAAEGESCDNVPAQSLPWLIEQGLVVLHPDGPVANEGTEA